MESRRIHKRRRILYDVRDASEDYFRVAKIVVEHISREGFSERLLESIYHSDVGREAIRSTIQDHTLTVDDIHPDRIKFLIESLSKFNALRSLTIERSRYGCLDFIDFPHLADLTQLKTLKLKRCLGPDYPLMQQITRLPSIEEVIMEDTYGLSDCELVSMTCLEQLRSFSLIATTDTPLECDFQRLTKCTNLQSLTLKLSRACILRNLHCVDKFSRLHTLVLSSHSHPVPMDSICRLRELRALTLQCSMSKEQEDKLGDMIRLTKLEFHTRFTEFPDWIRDSSYLQILSIFWATSRPGKIGDHLPQTLRELTLRGIEWPTAPYAFLGLERIKKLALYYRLPKNGNVRSDALSHMLSIEDLLLKCVSYSDKVTLPDFDRMKLLTRLDIETTAVVDLTKQELGRLRHLALGMKFGKEDFSILSKMTTLETLILKNAVISLDEDEGHKTGNCIKCLTALPNLRDLCFYCCSNIDLSLENMQTIFTSFESLIHMGMSPLDTNSFNVEILPNRFRREPTRYDKWFNPATLNDEERSLYDALKPSVVSDALVLDNGYRVLKIDTDCWID